MRWIDELHYRTMTPLPILLIWFIPQNRVDYNHKKVIQLVKGLMTKARYASKNEVIAAVSL